MSGNDCDDLEIGSFYFHSVNLWPIGYSAEGLYVKNEGRHGDVTIFPFDDIPGGLDLYLTDRAWSQADNAFVPNNIEGEGIVSYRTPPGGITAGVIFGMGNNSLIGETAGDWVDVDVNGAGVDTSQYFELGEDGDQIFLYCVGSDGRDRPISAFAYGEDFLRPSTTNGAADISYGTHNSSAPDYFFEVPPPDSLMSSPTPGMLEMRPPSECYHQIYWFWEFEDPCFGRRGCIMDFYDLRNSMSNKGFWIGKNPDGMVCRRSSATIVSGVFGLGLMPMVVMLWLFLCA